MTLPNCVAGCIALQIGGHSEDVALLCCWSGQRILRKSISYRSRGAATIIAFANQLATAWFSGRTLRLAHVVLEVVKPLHAETSYGNISRRLGSTDKWLSSGGTER
jgi:hypothetical protein